MQDFLENNPLWDFAVKLYSQKPIASRLLALQDNDGLNINILLTLVWLGQSGKKLTTDDVDKLIMAIDIIDANIVQPLRTARRNLKTLFPLNTDLYEKAKDLELVCEHIVLDQLFLEAQRSRYESDAHDFSDHNLEIYCNIATNSAEIMERVKRFYHE